jgi:hypothetical protein
MLNLEILILDCRRQGTKLLLLSLPSLGHAPFSSVGLIIGFTKEYIPEEYVIE